MGSKITNIEYYFPKKKVTNQELNQIFPDYDFKNFEKKVGIKSRYVVEEETALDLAVNACKKVLSNFEKEKIDYIIYCTQSPEYFLPTTACILQNQLGLRKNIGAFDFNLGCSGYIYGLGMAKSLIETGMAENVLLVTAETYSKYIHPKDRSNRAIFGDAAAATIISKSEEEHFMQFMYGTDGSGFNKLIVKNGGSKFPLEENPEEIPYGTNNSYTENHLYMDGPEIFNFTAETIPNFTIDLIHKNGLEKEEVGQYILHQANAYMLNFMRKKMGVEKEKFYINLEESGNTVSCTIPIALKNYLDEGNKEQYVALVGFGVGLSWGGCMIKI